MARRRISAQEGSMALASLSAGSTLDSDLATACRFLLEELSHRHPGKSVEVRVPPFGATQCLEGPSHTRGTPSNVVELEPWAWIELATGRKEFSQLLAEGRISASGVRSDLAELFPIFRA